MKMINIILLFAAAIILTGCASVGPQGGLLFHDLKYGVNATQGNQTTKTGEACSSSVLGLVGTGDASIETAKKNGGITTVTSIDASSWSLLFFYNKYCTIVKGN